MARINISETQFAFAFFHKFVQFHLPDDLTFVFPTLRQEGNPLVEVGGADLVINNNLFFQFKVGDILWNANAREIINGQLPPDFTPYFRFNIKNSLPTTQFDTLLARAAAPHNTVKYISPLFDYGQFENDDDAFYDFFRRDPQDSFNYIAETNFDQFIANNPNINQTDARVICYNRDSVLNQNTGFLFSDPEQISIKKGLNEIKNGTFMFPQGSLKISEQIDLLKRVFKIEDKQYMTISSIQTVLIVRYNIYWIPVVRDNRKTKLLK